MTDCAGQSGVKEKDASLGMSEQDSLSHPAASNVAPTVLSTVCHATEERSEQSPQKIETSNCKMESQMSEESTSSYYTADEEGTQYEPEVTAFPQKESEENTTPSVIQLEQCSVDATVQEQIISMPDVTSAKAVVDDRPVSVIELEQSLVGATGLTEQEKTMLTPHHTSVKRIVDSISYVFPPMFVPIDLSTYGKKEDFCSAAEGNKTTGCIGHHNEKKSEMEGEIYYSDSEEKERDMRSYTTSQEKLPNENVSPKSPIHVEKKKIGRVVGQRRKLEKNANEIAHIRKMRETRVRKENISMLTSNSECLGCKEVYSFMGSVCISESKRCVYICRYCGYGELSITELLRHITALHPILT